MRLRDLTPSETAAVEAQREAVREDLARIGAPWVPDADAIAAAPFMDDYEPRGGGLFGLCWGHAKYGNAFVTTSDITHRGDGWAISQTKLYLLGAPRPAPADRLDRILSGRRGAGRPAAEPALDPEAIPGPKAG